MKPVTKCFQLTIVNIFLFIYLFIFFSNLVKFIFPLFARYNFPLRDPGILWGLYAIVKFKKTINISFIHQKTLSPAYTMRSYDDLHDTITYKYIKKMFLAKSFNCRQDLDFVRKEKKIPLTLAWQHIYLSILL